MNYRGLAWNRQQDGAPPIEWDQRAPRYVGDALVDIHGGQGTTWRKDANGAYYPDCDCHSPYQRRRR